VPAMKSKLKGRLNDPFKPGPPVAGGVADQFEEPLMTPTWAPTYQPLQS
jgi:hypothetical protein